MTSQTNILKIRTIKGQRSIKRSSNAQTIKS